MPRPGTQGSYTMEFHNRKYPRLKQYDYSLPGYYFITIHNAQGAPVLSTITQQMNENGTVHLTVGGVIAQEQLWMLEKRYDYVKIDKFVIMPTHIHVIIRLLDGLLPRPGISEIVGTYKSLTTREMNRKMGTSGLKRFQRSFYDRVIRTQKAYEECWLYIDGNPGKWITEPEDL